jgi:hypothetical protein
MRALRPTVLLVVPILLLAGCTPRQDIDLYNDWTDCHLRLPEAWLSLLSLDVMRASA